jgi:hypothetical protein
MLSVKIQHYLESLKRDSKCNKKIDLDLNTIEFLLMVQPL